MAEKHAKTDISDTEMDTEPGGEAGTSHKKGHMTNIYLTDSNEKAIVDFLREWYNKTHEYSKDKVRKMSWRGSPTVTSLVSKCARPVLNCNGHIMRSSCNPSLVRLQKK